MKHQLLFSFAQFIIDNFTAHKTLIAFLVIGMASGLIAQLIMPGRGHGLVITAIIGIAGAYLGLLFINQYISFATNHIIKEFVGAIVGSCVLTLIANLIMPNRDIKTKHN